MKKALVAVVVLLTITTFANAQTKEPTLPVDPETKKITYTEVVTLDSSVKQTQLHLAAKQWFALAFRDAQEVIQLDDKESGTVIGKGSTPFFTRALGLSSQSGHIRFTVTINCKDGKYRYQFTSYRFTDSKTTSEAPAEQAIDYKGIGKKTVWFQLQQIEDNTQGLIIKLKSAMASAASTASNNW